MTMTPKEFQTDYVAELLEKFAVVQGLAEKDPAGLLLNAPTGSGKTFMATALIESLLFGTDDTEPDPNLVFLWLTDQPELNKQTYDKMVETSGTLVRDDLVIIDAGMDAESLTAGKVYFLNTQKLGASTTFVKTGDSRTFTLWDTLRNTIENDPTRFVLFYDEAHRGTRGLDAAEAETIVQKFLKGSPGELPPVPLIVGISATPAPFVALCAGTARPLFQVNVDPERVRESGLLKEFVDLFHPDEEQPSQVTMLIQAVSDWKRYRDDWRAYGEAEDEDVPSPVLLVQVADATAASKAYSKTDLAMVVNTLADELGPDATDGWIAHAFQDDLDLSVAGRTIRHIAPSAIDIDSAVKVVLFKTSLNTGWDCPRAEVMVSFRTANDEINIAQLVGRMVRAPLARRVDANEHLNTVALYLPYYNQAAVEKVVTFLTSDPGIVPPTGVRKGKEVVTLSRASGMDACFAALSSVPTYTIPPTRPMKPSARLARLAALLGDCGLETNPVKTYRAALLNVLREELDRLVVDDDFKHALEEASALDALRRRFAYGVADDGDGASEVLVERPEIAEQDIDALYNEAGRKLGEALHKEYLRARLEESVAARDAKIELHALVEVDGVLAKVDGASDDLRRKWVTKHKAAIGGMDEKHRQALRSIEAAGIEPEEATIDPPMSIEWKSASTTWAKHLYVDTSGELPDDFAGSSWERKVVEAETERPEIVGWFRNPDRKPWSLRIARQEGIRWISFYPDFIFFRDAVGGVIAEIVDPHLMSADDMPQRAVALAQYAQKHSDRFGRIEMVIFENAADTTGRRLDLMVEETRNAVAIVTSREQLKALFAATR